VPGSFLAERVGRAFNLAPSLSSPDGNARQNGPRRLRADSSPGGAVLSPSQIAMPVRITLLRSRQASAASAVREAITRSYFARRPQKRSPS
jgi:hypothetical protein